MPPPMLIDLNFHVLQYYGIPQYNQKVFLSVILVPDIAIGNILLAFS
jgi:hypothetical protein